MRYHSSSTREPDDTSSTLFILSYSEYSIFLVQFIENLVNKIINNAIAANPP